WAIEQRWGGIWRWLLPALILAIVLVFVAAPAPLPHNLLVAMGGVCALRPEHSYFAGGVQLPLEARMTGIYGGFLLTLLILLALRRVGARRLGNWPVIGILGVFFASMAFDGINSTLAELHVPHLYTPTNELRLISGLLSGIAIAPFLVWLLSVMAVPKGHGTRLVVRSPWELAAPLALNAAYAALVLDGRAWFYFPVAFLSVAGIITVVASGVLLVILVIGELEARITRPSQIVAPAALAFLVAFAIFAATATLRWTLVGAS
ncbi:MAG TPA: DUF2085 domain-containing protein, partial [Herpetosiphonaceae bacterium]|nr:DUF2085 domain-containing protein [Herpetosiphonaceae bacterium]